MSTNDRFTRGDFQKFWGSVENGMDYPLRVTGSSMFPFLIHEESMVYIRKPDSLDFRKGQILLFSRPDGAYILHRVLKVTADGKLLMNGDSQTWDEMIPREAVCAVVTKFIRKKRVVSVDSVGYKMLAAIWMQLYPCRSIMIKLGHGMRSIIGALKSNR